MQSVVSALADHASVLSALIFCFCLACGGVIRRIAPIEQSSAYHGRLRYLDGLRAVAALMVVSGHNAGLISGLIDEQHRAIPIGVNLGSLGVQIFFCISGFLFAGKVLRDGCSDPAAFFLGRARRILPLYLMTVTVALAIVVAYADAPLDLRGVARLYLSGAVIPIGVPVLGGINTEEVIGTVWSLRYEWAFYLFVPLLAFALSDRRRAMISTAAVLVFGAATIKRDAQTLFWLFFLPGIVMAVIDAKKLRVPMWLRYVLGIVALALSAWILQRGQGIGYDLARFGLVAVIFAAVVLSAPAVLRSPTLCYMGDISYSVYLVHFPVLFLSKKLISAYYQTIWTTPVLQACVALASLFVALLLSALTHRFIESPFIHQRQQQPVTA